MTDHTMTATILWEHMLLADQGVRNNSEPDQCLGRSVASYREINGIAETRQLVVDLAPIADRLWDMFEPVHECNDSFDLEWTSAFLHRLSDLSGDMSKTSHLFQLLAAAEASGALDLQDGVSELVGLHGFHVEHKMEVIEDDGTGYVDDYHEGEVDDCDTFWTVYGRNEEGLAIAIADIDQQYSQEAAEKLASDMEEWLEQAA